MTIAVHLSAAEEKLCSKMQCVLRAQYAVHWNMRRK